MLEIKNILNHFNQNSELTKDNILLAKKAALLELKFNSDDLIKIGTKKYSKDDLLVLFTYFEDDKKVILYSQIEKNADFERLKDLDNIGYFSNIPDNFKKEENYSEIIKYITENFSTTFLKKILALYKSKKDYSFKQIIYLNSFLPYFSLSFKSKVKNQLKNSILVEMVTITDNDFKLGSKNEFKNTYLYNKDFIAICGIVGNNDADFLVEVLDVSINVYNSYKKYPENLLTCLIAHKELNHSYENMMMLDENIEVFSQDEESGDKNFYWKYAGYVIFVLFIIFKACRNTHSSHVYNKHSTNSPYIHTKDSSFISGYR